MKINNNVIAGAFIALFAIACDNDGYIDPITTVDPGPDEAPGEETGPDETGTSDGRTSGV